MLIHSLETNYQNATNLNFISSFSQLKINSFFLTGLFLFFFYMLNFLKIFWNDESFRARIQNIKISYKKDLFFSIFRVTKFNFLEESSLLMKTVTLTLNIWEMPLFLCLHKSFIFLMLVMYLSIFDILSSYWEKLLILLYIITY